MTPDDDLPGRVRFAHARLGEWDAAYVLGALAPPDRREFEAHLAECGECRGAVAELAPTVGLLSRLTAEDAERLEDGPDAAGRAGFVSLARARGRRRRRTWWIAGVAAALLVVAAVAVPVAIGATSRPTAAFALEDVAGVPLEASVRLTDVAWGTRIELTCHYADVYIPDAPKDGWTYTLAVVGADGTAADLSSWRAGPGSSARLSAGSALAVADIRAVEIRNAKGDVLMRYELKGDAG